MKCTCILLTCCIHPAMTSLLPVKNNLLPDTYGLVLCGGRSSRMGTDKSMLLYYDKPQRYNLYDMLQPFCEKVFISCNTKQAKNMEAGYAFLPDDPSYANMGPMAALLTAFTRFPQKNMLLIGCDYPFLMAVHLRRFSAYCNGERAVSFYNEQAAVYEPLLAWYPHEVFDAIKKKQEAGEYSLQHFLKSSGAVKFRPGNTKSMTSIDTYEDFINVSTRLFHERLTFF